MLAAISAVFDTEERSILQRRKRIASLGSELATYIRERQKAIAVVLLGGTRLGFAIPGTARFDYIAGLKGSLVVGTYNFSSIARAEWEKETQRAIADLDAAITEYWEGRFSHPPGAPGEH